MLATATELKAQKVTLEEFRFYAKKVYGNDYDPERTEVEWKNIDEKKTWKCITLRLNFPEVMEYMQVMFPKKPGY